MHVPAAYLGVILIWSTTPLAILWSSQGVGYLFGVSSRMLIGALLAIVIVTLLGSRIIWQRKPCQAYLASSMGLYGGMLTVYWAAQYIPTGWIAVIFGLSPIVTALMGRLWLNDEPLTRARLCGMLMGLIGLLFIFGASINIHAQMVAGVFVMLVSVLIQCASAVWIKRLNPHVPALVLTSGGLLFAAPLFLLTWIISGTPIPADIPTRSLASIGYLALLGSVVGFTLYYYVLSKVDATRVSLITLITPACALALGHSFNQEPITLSVILGTLLILSGLATFEFGAQIERIRQRFLND